MIAEVVVCVLQWRRCLQVQRRERLHRRKPRSILLMLPHTAIAFRNISGEQNNDAMKVWIRQTVHPAVWMVGARVPENLRPGGHSLAELFRKGSDRSFIDPEPS